MKFKYLVHTGFADEEFEIYADGYDIDRESGYESAVSFYTTSLLDDHIAVRTIVMRQSIISGYWIQTLTYGDRIERTNNNGS